MAGQELDAAAAVALLNEILETELAGVCRYTHYALMVFGHSRIPIVSWLRGEATTCLAHANEAGELGIGHLRPVHPEPVYLHGMDRLGVGKVLIAHLEFAARDPDHAVRHQEEFHAGQREVGPALPCRHKGSLRDEMSRERNLGRRLGHGRVFRPGTIRGGREEDTPDRIS